MAKVATAVRKSPRQSRSRATVEAILEATARILVEQGYEALTTNHVALRAGVSVGSLYQYFPNKQSLVRALLDRHLAEAVAMRPATLAPDAPTPLRERVGIAVRWYLAAHAADPALHRVLTERVAEIYGSEAVGELERALHRTLREVLERHADEVRPANLEIAAFFLAQCLESLTHGAVVHHPELLDQPELAAEMTALITGYLCGSQGPA